MAHTSGERMQVNHILPMSNDDLLYFAYGSNLDPLRKKQRTGPIREARKARLSGYRLAFNKRADDGGVYANVVCQPGSEVWGIVYRCNHEALASMDIHEGVSGGHYERCYIEVEVTGGEIVQAITYVSGAIFICPDEQPTEEYLERIIRGAKCQGLPDRYIKQIKAIAAGMDPNGSA